MDIINFFIELLRDPRTFIAQWIVDLGPIWVYVPLFLVIFCETGLVVTPFLPGDSLIFTAGIFAADGGGLNLFALLIILIAAAILGNTSNYWIGRKFGEIIMKSGKVKALNEESVAKAHGMFDKYGLFAIVLTRFFPIIRTIAPFLAGMGRMSFPRFTFFNAVGGALWVSLFTFLGYFFGGIPFVQEHFSLVVIAIIVVSVIPAFAGAIKAWLSSRKKAAEQDETREPAKSEATNDPSDLVESEVANGPSDPNDSSLEAQESAR